jgi:hypothetical protein
LKEVLQSSKVLEYSYKYAHFPPAYIPCIEAEGNKVFSLDDVKIEVLCKYLLTIFPPITVNILYSVQAELPA